MYELNNGNGIIEDTDYNYKINIFFEGNSNEKKITPFYYSVNMPMPDTPHECQDMDA